jgi:hypothetical protein
MAVGKCLARIGCSRWLRKVGSSSFGSPYGWRSSVFFTRQMDGVAVAPAAASHRMLHNTTCLGHIHRAPPRLIFREQFCG